MKYYPTPEQLRSITPEMTFERMTKAQQQRTLARRRQAELFWTESVRMREQGLNAQARLLEQDAKRYDIMARNAHRVWAEKIATELYAPLATLKKPAQRICAGCGKEGDDRTIRMCAADCDQLVCDECYTAHCVNGCKK